MRVERLAAEREARDRRVRARREEATKSRLSSRFGKVNAPARDSDDDASSDGGNDEPNAIARARATYLAARGIGPTSREETDSHDERARRDRRRMFPSGTGSATGSPTRPVASNGAYERREGTGGVERLAASVRASTPSTGRRRSRRASPSLLHHRLLLARAPDVRAAVLRLEQRRREDRG